MLYHCPLYSGVSPRAFLPGAVPGVCTVSCTLGLAQQCGAVLHTVLSWACAQAWLAQPQPWVGGYIGATGSSAL